MTSLPDRLQRLLAQSKFTGLDFIYVYEDQNKLDVYFLRAPETLDSPLTSGLIKSQIAIQNINDPSVPGIEVDSIAWKNLGGRAVLEINVSGTPLFTPYTLTIGDKRVDAYYNGISFSFQANCDNGLDCEPEDEADYQDDIVDFPVDYRPRDFASFRRALFDFASQRYPNWNDRLEADVGVMMVEVMSALGDEMAYYQDRVSREAYLETATQRRSLRSHARIVDYEPHDGRAASGWLDVTANDVGVVPVGTQVTTTDLSVVFEVGTGLFDDNGGYEVDPARNSLTPHIWDEDNTTLPTGSTEMFIKGHHKAILPLDDGESPEGRWVLLQTTPSDPSIPQRRWFVHLIEVEQTTDPLADVKKITRLAWESGQATPFPLELTELEVRGNVMPITAGVTIEATFEIGESGDPEDHDGTIELIGANGTRIHRYSLPESRNFLLDWLGEDLRTTVPEIRLYERDNEIEWSWRRSLLGVASSASYDEHFTLEDGTWGRVVSYQRPTEEIIHADYLSNSGFTIRFGDDEFGKIPQEGSIFDVQYRIGFGQDGNIAQDTLTQLTTELTFVDAVSNPLPSTDGVNPESAADVRRNAPEAWKAETYRAVRPIDYAEAAERLEWVDNAGARARWTGSWLTTFTTPDPKNAVTLTDPQRTELDEQLNRFRLAGRDAHQKMAIYANIDLEISVCAELFAYPGDVREGVIEALTGALAYFSPDRFTFGTKLYRSPLEAAIQRVHGVKSVESIRIRRRGWFEWRDLNEYAYDPGISTIIRLENDLQYPERGTLSVTISGGA